MSEEGLSGPDFEEMAEMAPNVMLASDASQREGRRKEGSSKEVLMQGEAGQPECDRLELEHNAGIRNAARSGLGEKVRETANSIKGAMVPPTRDVADVQVTSYAGARVECGVGARHPAVLGEFARTWIHESAHSATLGCFLVLTVFLAACALRWQERFTALSDNDDAEDSRPTRVEDEGADGPKVPVPQKLTEVRATTRNCSLPASSMFA